MNAGYRLHPSCSWALSVLQSLSVHWDPTGDRNWCLISTSFFLRPLTPCGALWNNKFIHYLLLSLISMLLNISTYILFNLLLLNMFIWTLVVLDAFHSPCFNHLLCAHICIICARSLVHHDPGLLVLIGSVAMPVVMLIILLNIHPHSDHDKCFN